MQTRPDITQDAIAAALRDRYGLALQGLEFWPAGEASYGFIASLANGDSLFLKILDPTLATHSMAIAHLDEVLPLSLALSEAGLPVSRPVQTRTGRPYTDIDRFALVAFEYLDGETLGEKQWSADVYAQLGAAVGRLHSLTSELAEVTPPRDGTAIPSRVEIIALLDQIEAASGSDRAARRTLAEMVTPLRSEVMQYHEVMSKLSEGVQRTRADWVLCHTDLTGGNLIRGGNGTVHIIDWEGACLAPREFDLAFFADEPFEERYGIFLEEYARASGVVDLREEAFVLRMYHRNFEDFVEGSRSVLEQDLGDAELDHALDVVLDDCVNDWPFFSHGARKHGEFMEIWREGKLA